MRDTDDLFAALALLIIGTGIIVVWTEPVPDWVLFAGYASLGLFVLFLVAWFVKGKS